MTVTYRCIDGYFNPTGLANHTLKCSEGKFPSLNEFSCWKSCGDPPSPDGSLIYEKTEYHVRYGCLDGYDLISGGYITCQDGRWSNDFGINCHIPCGLNNIPAGVNIKQLTISELDENLVVNYECLDGYHPLDNYSLPFSINCESGYFSSLDGLICERDCPLLQQIQGTSITITSYSATFVCHDGYTMSGGDSTLQCKNGVWIGETAVCSRLCPEKPPEGNNSHVYVMGPPHAYTAYYFCYDDHHAPIGFSNDTLVIECVEGVYQSDEGLKCEKDCSVILEKQPMYTRCIYESHYVTCVCYENYTNIGSDRMDCINGNWTAENPPVCIQHCDPDKIPDVEAATKLTEGPEYNQTITYTCNDG